MTLTWTDGNGCAVVTEIPDIIHACAMCGKAEPQNVYDLCADCTIIAIRHAEVQKAEKLKLVWSVERERQKQKAERSKRIALAFLAGIAIFFTLLGFCFAMAVTR